MKKVKLALLGFAAVVSVLTVGSPRTEAAIYDESKIDFRPSKEDNLKAIEILKSKGILDDCPYPIENLTTETPLAVNLNETYLPNKYTTYQNNNGDLIRARNYPIASIYSDPPTGVWAPDYRFQNVQGIKITELSGARHDPQSNGIASVHAIKPPHTTNYCYFLYDYTEDTGVGTWDNGYYYRYFRFWDTNWYWNRYVWCSVADKADLFN